ncbi:MAG: ATP-dependent protease ATPase subunit HslU [Clostridia bacterium]|nr:ATP-dependent protease ATPase subunit HslU [Clostridia bacterium]
MTPKQIVAQLDKYIISQDEAKKAVAIALRNRYRRSRLSEEDREEITPKNIILKGPTGVGKTEIARRLAKLVNAPFVKVEATKYTEVGYVGRDVESMVRDLVSVAIRLVKEERYKTVEDRANQIAVDKVAELLLANKDSFPEGVNKATLKDEIVTGNLDHLTVDVVIAEKPQSIELQPGSGNEINLGSIFGGIIPNRTKKRRVSVKEALRLLSSEASEKLIDADSVNAEAIRRAENDGLIFIDEIDKIAGKGSTNGPDVSREGVQRDILPIIEGCSVSTKYGNIKTDHILFIASGAFHVSSVSDLIPELQGRFPILVELNSLDKNDFVKILTETENAITEQYSRLLAVDNIYLQFTKDGIAEIAELAVEMNNTQEDIGARRLQSILEHITEDISYNVEEENKEQHIVIDAKYVRDYYINQAKSLNLKKYII